MDHIGEVYTGVISGIMDFGFFVMLDNTVEGLVRLDSLKGDYYSYNKNRYMIIGKIKEKCILMVILLR